MKAIELLKVLSDSNNDFGEFAIVENAFFSNCYFDWLTGVLEHRLGITTIKQDVMKVYRGKGYDKIRKYMNNHSNKSVIVYGYLNNYRKENHTIFVESKKSSVKHCEGDILIFVKTYESAPDCDGKFFESGYIVELLK